MSKFHVKNHHVILYVDTSNISEGTEEQHSWLDIPNNDIPNDEWWTKVDPGEYITWSGLSVSSPDDIVNITGIRHESDSNVFGRTKLHGNGHTPEKVIGTINNDNNDEKETYMIKFTVYNGNNGGKKSGSFRVDPVIRVRPTGTPE